MLRRIHCRTIGAIIIILIISGVLITQFHTNPQNRVIMLVTPITPTSRHVTKSLAELGPVQPINPHYIFLNSIPYSGSELLVLLLNRMQGANSFKHIRLITPPYSKDGEESLIYNVQDFMQKQPIPLAFDTKTPFINFQRFDKQSPMFITIIREPALKIVNSGCVNASLACEIWAGNHQTIPYFCGMDPKCFEINSQWALDKAKFNVEKYYGVVGVLEELNKTLQTLQDKIPNFFRNYQQFYAKEIRKYEKKKQRKIDVKLRKHYRALLTKEYEFYEWIRRRLV